MLQLVVYTAILETTDSNFLYPLMGDAIPTKADGDCGESKSKMDKLLDNVREMMNEIQSAKPESFGRGKKGQKKVAKGTKYYLKAHLSSTQGKGSVLVDLKTIDPTNTFFMSDPSSVE